MYEDTLDEWLGGYISWQEGEDTARMTRREYYRRHFPKEFNPTSVFEQLQKVKTEMRANGAIKAYCSEHGAYDLVFSICPKCDPIEASTGLIGKKYPLLTEYDFEKLLERSRRR